MSADEQLAGLEVPTGTAGYCQRHVALAVEAASLDARDKGMGALAIAAARGVDLAQGRRDPFAIAATIRELRETLTRLRMDPESRMGSDAGEVQQWLEGLKAE